MKLRKFEQSDSAIICNWVKDKKTLYQWSADKIGSFPLNGNELNEVYTKMGKDVIPLTAVDDENKTIIGHMFIKYLDEMNKKIVRFGFVIVSPSFRGQGCGKKMLQLAITYVKEVLNASQITLGVFVNNPIARHCYESIGFNSNDKSRICKFGNEEWQCDEMEITL